MYILDKQLQWDNVEQYNKTQWNITRIKQRMKHQDITRRDRQIHEGKMNRRKDRIM